MCSDGWFVPLWIWKPHEASEFTQSLKTLKLSTVSSMPQNRSLHENLDVTCSGRWTVNQVPARGTRRDDWHTPIENHSHARMSSTTWSAWNIVRHAKPKENYCFHVFFNFSIFPQKSLFWRFSSFKKVIFNFFWHFLHFEIQILEFLADHFATTFTSGRLQRRSKTMSWKS